jgi:uncharacterized damage-inducible protein DinB
VEPGQIIDTLKVTPPALRTAVRALKGDAIARPSGDGGWSVLEIVRHIRASDAILAPRVMQALVRDRPSFPSFDHHGWADLIAAADVPVDAQLAAFAIQRAELTALLRTLTAEQWQRTSVHEKRGEQSITAICEHIAEHEAEHVAQIDAMVRAYGATAR